MDYNEQPAKRGLADRHKPGFGYVMELRYSQR
jgi:hypothetical protein